MNPLFHIQNNLPLYVCLHCPLCFYLLRFTIPLSYRVPPVLLHVGTVLTQFNIDTIYCIDTIVLIQFNIVSQTILEHLPLFALYYIFYNFLYVGLTSEVRL